MVAFFFPHSHALKSSDGIRARAYFGTEEELGKAVKMLKACLRQRDVKSIIRLLGNGQHSRLPSVGLVIVARTSQGYLLYSVEGLAVD